MAVNKLHPSIKIFLGYDVDIPDETVLNSWKDALKSICKPCWELKYCPYGYLVDDFPFPPMPLKYAQEHTEYLKGCLDSGKLGDGRDIDEHRRKIFEERVKSFKPEEYPDEIPQTILDAVCKIWAHICPVFYTQSGATETEDYRREGRSLPFKMKVRVARRDNYTCQKCGKHLKDDELEFDHIIPVSRGGSSEEHNIRLTCSACNRTKSDKIEFFG